MANHVFSSVVSDIKTYVGNDPLLPWIQGVRKMRHTLPPHILTEKLPRFLQKCAQTFESDNRYRNDLRFIRIWLQLMDFVDDPKALLRKMETNRIGVKRSLFYQAYALYYEKLKKFEAAEDMYRLGVHNLAEPLEDLQKSFDQFLHRMERQKNKRAQTQEKRSSRRPLSESIITSKVEPGKSDESREILRDRFGKELSISKTKGSKMVDRVSSHGASGGDVSTNKQTSEEDLRKEEQQPNSERRPLQREDTIVINRFVNTAIVGKSDQAEDVCHHGLVEPTIIMKEAMNVINDMFREPLEPPVATRRKFGKSKTQPEEHQNFNSGFEVFVDEDMDGEGGPKGGKSVKTPQNSNKPSVQEPLQIFVDDEEECDERELVESQSSNLSSPSSSSRIDAFSFLRPDDHHHSESSDDASRKCKSSSRPKLRGEDTVVRRFVGSTIISDEPMVENICHHGLVDPTVNLREAMDDINGMFGKPMEFVRTSRRNKRLENENAASSSFSSMSSKDCGGGGGGGFSILPDDDLLVPPVKSETRSKNAKNDGFGLFEPTVHTKAAMDDINKMFAMPLNF